LQTNTEAHPTGGEALLYSSDSQLILKPAPHLVGKIIFAPLAPFDVLFFVLSSLTSTVAKVPTTRNWVGNINLAAVRQRSSHHKKSLLAN